MEKCPHCGASLPMVKDAFCSLCHGALDLEPILFERAARSIVNSTWPPSVAEWASTTLSPTVLSWPTWQVAIYMPSLPTVVTPPAPW